MNLDDALREFRRGRPYNAADLATIRAAVAALGVANFGLHAHYVHDGADIVHVHATMIVSKRKFPGSVDRGPEPYPEWPHFVALTRWRDR